MASKLSLLIILTLSLLFSCSIAARPLPAEPPAAASARLVFDHPEPAISNNPHRLDEYFRVHLPSDVHNAVGVLHSKDRSIMASFLDSQLMGLVNSQQRVLWTVFAPADDDILSQLQGEDLSSLLMRHLAPGRDVSLMDLKRIPNGTRFQKNMDGVPLQLTKTQDQQQLMVNGAEITKPDLFRGTWITVHGIKGVIPKQSIEEQQVRHHETDPFFTHAARQDS